MTHTNGPSHTVLARVGQGGKPIAASRRGSLPNPEAQLLALCRAAREIEATIGDESISVGDLVDRAAARIKVSRDR